MNSGQAVNITMEITYSAVSLPLEKYYHNNGKHNNLSCGNNINFKCFTIFHLESMQASENELSMLQAKECAYPDLTHIIIPYHSYRMELHWGGIILSI